MEDDLILLYVEQERLREKVITENKLSKDIKYIAGVDVAYHDLSQKMVGAAVVLDAETLNVVDSAVHMMEVTFPYVPGLFSFREIPPIKEAYKKLKIFPDLIVCDGQGIAHPKNIGMASHLGIELDIPTIGCAKKHLVGYYEKEKLGKERGDCEDLIWDDRIVGKALRTQKNINPLFISIGHKIDLDTAIQWILKLTPQYRLPETTRQADHLVNQYLKEYVDYDFFGDEDRIL
ncbi:deoxyribonuclease V [Dysgonomonas sp. 25]|nr:deoxyribonuclease V [Dysgonomonas sp. 25]